MDQGLCIEGCGFDGVIFICGEGLICEQCYADLADVPIADAFDQVDDPAARDRVRTVRSADRTLDEFEARVENPVRSG